MECQKYTCFCTSAKVLSLIGAVFSMFQVSEVVPPCYVPHQEACESVLKIFSNVLNVVQIHQCMICVTCWENSLQPLSHYTYTEVLQVWHWEALLHKIWATSKLARKTILNSVTSKVINNEDKMKSDPTEFVIRSRETT